MEDWNVVVSVNQRGFRQAVRLLGRFGPVRRTNFFNVLAMKVDDLGLMIESLRELMMEDPGALSFLSRLVPVTTTFTFQSPEEFESRARESAQQWVRELGGKSFHVRMHRRGFRGKLLSPEEERFLDEALLRSLDEMGSPGRITFDNPDAIIAIETIGQRAGLSLWTREDLQRYPFVRLD